MLSPTCIRANMFTTTAFSARATHEAGTTSRVVSLYACRPAPARKQVPHPLQHHATRYAHIRRCDEKEGQDTNSFHVVCMALVTVDDMIIYTISKRRHHNYRSVMYTAAVVRTIAGRASSLSPKLRYSART